MATTVTITPYLDENPTPRVEVLVQGAPAGFVTVTRSTDQRSYEVQGAIVQPTGSGVSVIDAAVPFGVPVTYQAQLFDTDGITSLGFVTSDPITLPVIDIWVHQPLDPHLAVKVDLTDASAASLTRGFDGETVYPDGASVGVWVGGRRRGLEGVQLELETSTQADMDTLQSIFGGYGDDEPAVICVRTPPGFSRLPRTLYLACKSPTVVDINVRYGGTLTVLQVTGDEVRPPAPGLVAALLRYQDTDLFFGTYSAIDANYGSYLARDRDYAKAGYAG